MNPTNKQAKVALVTGGAKRIGAELVKSLHKASFKVVIHCHNSLKEAQNLALELNQQRPDSVLVLEKELTEKNCQAYIIQKTLEWGLRLDVLVNNASVFRASDCMSLSFEEWDLQFEINLKIPFILSLEARPYLAKTKGLIVNITDIHAQKPLKGYAAYCQSKAALEMQTKSLALEFAPDIRVNAIAPGAIAWPEGKNTLTAKIQEKIIEKTPLKRHGSPTYIAQALLFLVENSYITGQIINVDGGRSVV